MDNPLVQPDPGLFIWTIITFLILLGLLAKFAWGPLLKALDERHATIRKSLDDADKAQQELAQLQEKSAQLIAEARAEGQSIVAKSRAAAEVVREDLHQKAKTEAAAMVKATERQIQQETARAVQQIRHEVVDLSLSVASKLIKKNLTAEDNDALIQDSLSQIDASRSS
ncbi:MAG: F0F1 ATP synthase subunit B [Acidobacteriota bacterium]|jgi:F-type H+-transporting ATPase subunit b|nr:F0F1 ATP synthase subunit B [Acidobacteriota bacterium]